MAGVTGLAPQAHGAADSPPAVARPPFNPAHVRTLLWMRWKLAIRGFARGKARAIIGLVILFVFLAPFLAALAIGTTIGYLRLPHPVAIQLLFVVLAGVYLVWVALPLLQYTLNEGLDVTRLQIYPITRAELMVSLVLATLFDIGTLGILLVFVPIVIGWSPTPLATVFTVVALVLAYIHTIGMSQLVMAALMGMLRSRRYRDLSIIIFAILGGACSAFGQFAGRLIPGADPHALLQVRVDAYLQYTPPGMAARAISLASGGDYLPALAWLAGLAALVPVLLWVWAVVLERGITTAETAGAAPSRRERRQAVAAQARVSALNGTVNASANGAAGVAVTGARSATTAAGVTATTTPRWRGPLSPAARAIAAKDARYLWRDPQLKAALFSSLWLLILVVLPYGGGRQTGFALEPYRVIFASVPTLVLVLNLALNALGLERSGLQMLYLFPVRPRDVFWGKNLTIGLITFAAQIVLAVGLAVITGGWVYVPLALAGGLAAIFVLLACGNVTSVLLPFRVRELRMGRNSLSSENAALRAVLSLVTLFVTVLLLLPVAAAIGLPLALDQWGWFVWALPAAIGYGILLHQVATRLVAPLMLSRVTEILNVTVRE
ncbi:MAG TPA: hypothetical protein VIG30_15965 [Ktedonobacterales bacterium]|jgi:ABC-2 type transport system permease protein